MKNVVIASAIVGFLTASPSFAAEWHCTNASDAPECYVTSVQIRNGVHEVSGISSGSKYLFVEYIDSGGHARSFQLKDKNYYVTMDSLRATEALALTALTTGLPIAWYGTANSAWFLVIGKPDVPITRTNVPANY